MKVAAHDIASITISGRRYVPELTGREDYERAAELLGLSLITDGNNDGTITLRLHAYQGLEGAWKFDKDGKLIGGAE